MDVSIRCRNVEVSDGVRAAAHEKVARLGRFLEGMEHADVLFAEERNPRIADREVCEVMLTGHGHLVRAKASAADQLSAVDRVVDKLEHQIQKLKGKLLGRSHPRRHGSLDSIKSAHSLSGAGSATDGDGDADLVPGEGEVQIVKTKRFSIKPMAPEEAVLQMELLGHDFYFFTNAETSQAAVVYRRDDGFVGLIEGS